jgi:hypothetical protein
MKPTSAVGITTLCTLGVLLAGCASTGETSTSSQSTAAAATGSAAPIPSRYKADDGRSIEIGKNTSSEGGLRFKEPHMDKCWIADGLNFNGYDTLYIAPTKSTAKFHDDEAKLHDWAKQQLPLELASYISRKGIFANVVTSESAIKPGAKVLKLENTITEYSKGGGAGRYFAGIYGAGQPNLRVDGKMFDGDKPVFTFDMRRSGASAAGRLSGGFMRDEEVQVEDMHSMGIDLTDFVAAVAGKYAAR